MPQPLIDISIPAQRLHLAVGDQLLMDVAVSTAKNGPGEINGSLRTPRGWHLIRAKIGAGCVPNTVFVNRRPTGEIYSPQLRTQFPQRDWILTRILWLSGTEPGKNRLGKVDTMRRFIYIHGCPDEDVMGVAGSHGCVKMRNSEIIELFDRVPVGTRVFISE
ncbi:MAG: L,D-transpeptidase [Gammaproteobacteria bacterium]|nr:L,D-transpeptidase [Gammaproteobacteria bacterium]